MELRKSWAIVVAPRGFMENDPVGYLFFYLHAEGPLPTNGTVYNLQQGPKNRKVKDKPSGDTKQNIAGDDG